MFSLYEVDAAVIISPSRGLPAIVEVNPVVVHINRLAVVRVVPIDTDPFLASRELLGNRREHRAFCSYAADRRRCHIDQSNIRTTRLECVPAGPTHREDGPALNVAPVGLTARCCGFSFHDR